MGYASAAYPNIIRPIKAAVLSMPISLISRTPPGSDVPALTAGNQDQSSLQSLFSQFPLVSATLQTSTKRAYGRALDKLFVEHGSLSISFEDLDLVLSDYIQERYSIDPRPGSLQEMANLICAMCLVYHSQRDCFGLARRCVRGWDSNVPSRSSVPLAMELMLAFVARLFHFNHVDSAVALALSWAGYLRASEVLSLAWDNVALPRDVRIAHLGPNSAEVNIVNAKTGPLQFVPVKDVFVVRLLQIFASRRIRAL